MLDECWWHHFSTGNLTWVDKTPLDYLNWNATENPNKSLAHATQGKKDCVKMTTDTTKWILSDCYNGMWGYLCQSKLGVFKLLKMLRFFKTRSVSEFKHVFCKMSANNNWTYVVYNISEIRTSPKLESMMTSTEQIETSTELAGTSTERTLETTALYSKSSTLTPEETSALFGHLTENKGKHST